MIANPQLQKPPSGQPATGASSIPYRATSAVLLLRDYLADHGMSTRVDAIKRVEGEPASRDAPRNRRTGYPAC